MAIDEKELIGWKTIVADEEFITYDKEVADEWMKDELSVTPFVSTDRIAQYRPLSELPKDMGKEMFVVIAIDVIVGTRKYTSDPYCVWREGEDFIRWPHKFDPTHFCLLPKTKDHKEIP